MLSLLNASQRNVSMFGLFQVPALSPGNRALRNIFSEGHAIVANALLILTGLHVAAALFHHWILRDHTLRRMLAWRRG